MKKMHTLKKCGAINNDHNSKKAHMYKIYGSSYITMPSMECLYSESSFSTALPNMECRYYKGRLCTAMASLECRYYKGRLCTAMASLECRYYKGSLVLV